MGESWLLDYYGCAFRVLAVLRQLLTHGQKFDPESLYEPIEFETLHPYLVNKMSILYPPPYIGLVGPSWSELSPYGWIAGGWV